MSQTPLRGPGHAPVSSTSPWPVGQTGLASPPRNAYQSGPATSDRTQRCPNRNGMWPPIYKRQWAPHPTRSLDKLAQQRFYRCVQDAVAERELHRTTGDVLLLFARASDDRLSDVWISQATIADKLGLAESTVCHHVAKAKRLGWLVVQHRNRIDNGFVIGMSNMTRLQLPEHWQDRLDEERRERTATKASERRRRPARTTEPTRPRTRHVYSHQEPVHPTAAHHAASAGAAVARSASTTSFEQGRQQLADEYAGKPDLYEAAYDSFVEIWKKVRLNE
jgi:hypothetical protein